HGTAKDLAVATNVPYQSTLLKAIERGDKDIQPDKASTPEIPFHLYRKVRVKGEWKFPRRLINAVKTKSKKFQGNGRTKDLVTMAVIFVAALFKIRSSAILMTGIFLWMGILTALWGVNRLLKQLVYI